MTNGWTGGQYSLFRGLLGLSLVFVFVEHALGSAPQSATPTWIGDSRAFWPICAAGTLAALALASGFHARLAALVALCAFAALTGPAAWISDRGSLAIAILLLLHLFIPEAPYGSLAARNAPDPSGSWSLPRAIYAAPWIALSVIYAQAGLEQLAEHLEQPASATWVWLGLELSFLPLALWQRTRPWIWTAILVAGTLGFFLAPATGLPGGVWLLHLFAFDPGWIPGRRAASTERIFYDGDCGLCHRSVRFVLAEDRPGDTFRFAPIDSESFRNAVPEADRATFPDSTAVETLDGRLLVRSSATLYVLSALGGGWRILALLASALPGALRDRGYDTIARIRTRLFRRPGGACPIVTPELRTRFDL